MKSYIFISLISFIALVSAACFLVPGDPLQRDNPADPVYTAREITAFSFTAALNTALDEDVTGIISDTDITLTVPYGTDVTALIATVTVSGKSLTVGSVPQESGITSNDFTGPVTYTVTAANGLTWDYTVSVSTSRILSSSFSVVYQNPVNGNVAFSEDADNQIFETVAGESRTLQFIIRNYSEDYTIVLSDTSPVTFTGADAGNFKVTAVPPSEILPNGYVGFEAEYTPDSFGNHEAVLNIQISEPSPETMLYSLWSTGVLAIGDLGFEVDMYADADNVFITYTENNTSVISNTVLFNRSEDSGQTFTLNPAAEAASGQNAGMQSMTVSGTTCYLAYYWGNFIKSSDLGNTWPDTSVRTFQSGEDPRPYSIYADGTAVSVAYYSRMNARLEFAHSADDGDTWSTQVVDNTTSSDVGDYCALAGEGSSLYIFYYDDVNKNIMMASSDDGGLTWPGENIRVVDGMEYNTLTITDCISALVWNGNVYVLYGDDLSTYIAWSSDGGGTWLPENRRTIGSASDLVKIAGSDSRLFVVFTDSSSGKLKLIWSDDGGATWPEENYSQPDVRNPVGTDLGFALSGNNMYLLYTKYFSSGSRAIIFRRSVDNGATWK